jgi:hypothetical protein
VLVGYFGEATGTADITIGGLGTAPKADLYFYHRGDFPGTYTFGATAPFAGAGVFTAGNTVYIPNVPVVDGKIVGRFTEGTSLLGLVSGLTVALAPAAAPGPLHVELKPAGPVVSWSGGGTLQSANRIDGGWTDVPGAASPYAVAPSAPQQFFRLKQ